MALQPDDTVCFCFHVTLRKIETFCKTQKPQVPSQISDCLSAGTGCGWCRPLLVKLHAHYCGEQVPWWRKPADAGASSLEDLTLEEHQAGRTQYLQQPPKEKE